MQMNNMALRFLASALMAATALSSGALGDDRKIQITIDEPISTGEAITVAERLGQIQYAAQKCRFVPDKPTLQVLVTKQLEGGAGGNMQMQEEILDERARLAGPEIVCNSLLKMFGPSGSVIKGAVSVTSEGAAVQNASGPLSEDCSDAGVNAYIFTELNDNCPAYTLTDFAAPVFGTAMVRLRQVERRLGVAKNTCIERGVQEFRKFSDEAMKSGRLSAVETSAMKTSACEAIATIWRKMETETGGPRTVERATAATSPK